MTGVDDPKDGMAGILWVRKPWLEVLKAVSVHVADEQLGDHVVGPQAVAHNSYHGVGRMLIWNGQFPAEGSLKLPQKGLHSKNSQKHLPWGCQAYHNENEGLSG
ncbi:hypothetical protein HPB48_017385 [Haemaphysalis longicornis]|uniref:Uncharacterized protein n=1 Tax=Haemaphysalis longicornis TaxID=44386 RepID=A0A9J6G9W3_HAELO|nr:hypothetical protein HPB48_017385 [Haemaphysalis longicornis]